MNDIFRLAQDKRSPDEYPLGTLAYYGPDDKIVTKIAAGVIAYKGADPIIKGWYGAELLTDEVVREEIGSFFTYHKVRKVVMTGGIIGCPHEEGIDFPGGEDCPYCPFWQGKQGINKKPFTMKG